MMIGHKRNDTDAPIRASLNLNSVSDRHNVAPTLGLLGG
jgi:hypothetical protein